jgi:polar amino acid transport system substrate-binding protein
MEKVWLRGWIILVAMILGIGFGDVATADLKDIAERGELRVAVQEDGPPFSFVDKKGVRTGSSVEFAQMMAEEMGVKATFVALEWEDLIPTLLSGEVDLIAADMTATLERALKISFSDPFYLTGTVVFTKKGRYFRAPKDCNKGIVTVAVTKGTTGEKDAKVFLPNAKRKAYKGGTAQLIRAVLKGQTDIGISDETAVMGAMAKFKAGSIKVLPEMLSKQPLSFAVRHEDITLLNWVNLFFQWVRGDGRYDKNVNYWVKSRKWTKDH